MSKYSPIAKGLISTTTRSGPFREAAGVFGSFDNSTGRLSSKLQDSVDRLSKPRNTNIPSRGRGGKEQSSLSEFSRKPAHDPLIPAEKLSADASRPPTARLNGGIHVADRTANASVQTAASLVSRSGPEKHNALWNPSQRSTPKQKNKLLSPYQTVPGKRQTDYAATADSPNRSHHLPTEQDTPSMAEFYREAECQLAGMQSEDGTSRLSPSKFAPWYVADSTPSPSVKRKAAAPTTAVKCARILTYPQRPRINAPPGNRCGDCAFNRQSEPELFWDPCRALPGGGLAQRLIAPQHGNVDFDNRTGPAAQFVLRYDALHDEQTHQFFDNQRVRALLRKRDLISRDCLVKMSLKDYNQWQRELERLQLVLFNAMRKRKNLEYVLAEIMSLLGGTGEEEEMFLELETGPKMDYQEFENYLVKKVRQKQDYLMTLRKEYQQYQRTCTQQRTHYSAQARREHLIELAKQKDKDRLVAVHQVKQVTEAEKVNRRRYQFERTNDHRMRRLRENNLKRKQMQEDLLIRSQLSHERFVQQQQRSLPKALNSPRYAVGVLPFRTEAGPSDRILRAIDQALLPVPPLRKWETRVAPPRFPPSFVDFGQYEHEVVKSDASLPPGRPVVRLSMRRLIEPDEVFDDPENDDLRESHGVLDVPSCVSTPDISTETTVSKQFPTAADKAVSVYCKIRSPVGSRVVEDAAANVTARSQVDLDESSDQDLSPIRTPTGELADEILASLLARGDVGPSDPSRTDLRRTSSTELAEEILDGLLADALRRRDSPSSDFAEAVAALPEREIVQGSSSESEINPPSQTPSCDLAKQILNELIAGARVVQHETPDSETAPSVDLLGTENVLDDLIRESVGASNIPPPIKATPSASLVRVSGTILDDLLSAAAKLDPSESQMLQRDPRAEVAARILQNQELANDTLRHVHALFTNSHNNAKFTTVVRPESSILPIQQTGTLSTSVAEEPRLQPDHEPLSPAGPLKPSTSTSSHRLPDLSAGIPIPVHLRFPGLSDHNMPSFNSSARDMISHINSVLFAPPHHDVEMAVPVRQHEDRSAIRSVSRLTAPHPVISRNDLGATLDGSSVLHSSSTRAVPSSGVPTSTFLAVPKASPSSHHKARTVDEQESAHGPIQPIAGSMASLSLPNVTVPSVHHLPSPASTSTSRLEILQSSTAGHLPLKTVGNLRALDHQAHLAASPSTSSFVHDDHPSHYHITASPAASHSVSHELDGILADMDKDLEVEVPEPVEHHAHSHKAILHDTHVTHSQDDRSRVAGAPPVNSDPSEAVLFAPSILHVAPSASDIQKVHGDADARSAVVSPMRHSPSKTLLSSTVTDSTRADRELQLPLEGKHSESHQSRSVELNATEKEQNERHVVLQVDPIMPNSMVDLQVADQRSDFLPTQPQEIRSTTDLSDVTGERPLEEISTPDAQHQPLGLTSRPPSPTDHSPLQAEMTLSHRPLIARDLTSTPDAADHLSADLNVAPALPSSDSTLSVTRSVSLEPQTDGAQAPLVNTILSRTNLDDWQSTGLYLASHNNDSIRHDSASLRHQFMKPMAISASSSQDVSERQRIHHVDSEHQDYNLERTSSDQLHVHNAKSEEEPYRQAEDIGTSSNNGITRHEESPKSSAIAPILEPRNPAARMAENRPAVPSDTSVRQFISGSEPESAPSGSVFIPLQPKITIVVEAASESISSLVHENEVPPQEADSSTLYPVSPSASELDEVLSGALSSASSELLDEVSDDRAHQRSPTPALHVVIQVTGDASNNVEISADITTHRRADDEAVDLLSPVDDTTRTLSASSTESKTDSSVSDSDMASWGTSDRSNFGTSDASASDTEQATTHSVRSTDDTSVHSLPTSSPSTSSSRSKSRETIPSSPLSLIVDHPSQEINADDKRNSNKSLSATVTSTSDSESGSIVSIQDVHTSPLSIGRNSFRLPERVLSTVPSVIEDDVEPRHQPNR